MANVSIDKTILDDLIEFKLRHITEEIQVLLQNWHYKSSTTFIDDARKGKLKEAEMDAIAIRQLISERDHLRELLESGCAQE
jgi:hypothetical protein